MVELLLLLLLLLLLWLLLLRDLHSVAEVWRWARGGRGPGLLVAAV